MAANEWMVLASSVDKSPPTFQGFKYQLKKVETDPILFMAIVFCGTGNGKLFIFRCMLSSRCCYCSIETCGDNPTSMRF